MLSRVVGGRGTPTDDGVRNKGLVLDLLNAGKWRWLVGLLAFMKSIPKLVEPNVSLNK